MSTLSKTKINQLLGSVPSGTVMLSAWLSRKGYSSALQRRYKKSSWLDSVGYGAVKRSGEPVDYLGALYALQKQGRLSIHVGGRTALSLQGYGHYMDMGTNRVTLFGGSGEELPAWFKNYKWGNKWRYFATSFLPKDAGLLHWEEGRFSVKVSTPARALLECLYLAPKHQDFYECYELMEGLNALRPPSVQELLENCKSVKVKRLFLYLAEKCGHAWCKHLDLRKVNLGVGKRSLVKNGVYISKYKITVPGEWKESAVPAL